MSLPHEDPPVPADDEPAPPEPAPEADDVDTALDELGGEGGVSAG